MYFLPLAAKHDQEDLKIIVEQLGFQHITTDVTIPRDAELDSWLGGGLGVGIVGVFFADLFGMLMGA